LRFVFMFASSRLFNPTSTQMVEGPSPREYDLVIAGGGIAGLTLAAALQDSGFKIAIVEPQTESAAAAKGQAYALHRLSRQIFTGIGIWDAIAPQIEVFQRVEMADADCPHLVQLLPQDLGPDVDAIGHVAEHHVLLSALQASLKDRPNITWFCPYRVTEFSATPDGVTVQLAIANPVASSAFNSTQPTPEPTTTTLRAKLLVAADGSQSPIRQRLGISTQGWKYWQSCLVVTVAPEAPLPQTAYEHFWPSGPFAALPIPNQQWRIVWTAPHAEAEAILALDESTFLTELTRRFGEQMGRLRLTSRPFLFPVRLMQARQYVAPRVALVGDAAHCCHPVGGQGLNLGIRDVAALAEVLQTAQAAGEDLGNIQVLHRYQRWRRRENWLTLAFTDLLTRCFSNQWWPLQPLRRWGLWLMQRLPILKIIALKFMAGGLGRQPALARSGKLGAENPVKIPLSV
jgi:2-octaprenyl-6-methoxyphenol hydroxylase